MPTGYGKRHIGRPSVLHAQSIAHVVSRAVLITCRPSDGAAATIATLRRTGDPHARVSPNVSQVLGQALHPKNRCVFLFDDCRHPRAAPPHMCPTSPSLCKLCLSKQQDNSFFLLCWRHLQYIYRHTIIVKSRTKQIYRVMFGEISRVSGSPRGTENPPESNNAFHIVRLSGNLPPTARHG